MKHLKSNLDAIKDFPLFLLGLVSGLQVSILAHVETFTLAVTSAVIGYMQDDVWLGVAIFFGAFTTFRMLGEYVALIASKIDLLAAVIGKRREELNE